MLRTCALIVGILIAGCLAPDRPVDALAEKAAPSPVARSDLAAEPPRPADAPSDGNVTPLAVEEFDGRFWTPMTWGDACPDALGARHDLVSASGATHARFELAADHEMYDVRARLFVEGRIVGEGEVHGETLVIDLGPSAVVGTSRIEALVWFCDGVTLIDHGYVGAASFFDRPPPADYALIEGP